MRRRIYCTCVYLGMHVINGVEDLSDELSGVSFRVRALLDDSIEELAACHQLHHQIHLRLVLECLHQLDDVRVDQTPKNGNLPV